MASPSMYSSLLDATDPARLHAELWADYVCKVVSCWLPILLSTIVVGRDLIGSSAQCFPLELVSVPGQPENDTFVSSGNSTNNDFSRTSEYSRQISEFVNVYCAGKDSLHGKTMFSYQKFVMMLVIQAALMYTPFLIWNITIGRDIICNVRFIANDLKVVYERIKPGQEQREVTSESVQRFLLKSEQNWRNGHMMCVWYVIKQVVSITLSAVGWGVYVGYKPISVHSINEQFLCSVEDKFSVTCTVPAAPVHRYVWGANMVLLTFNVIVTLMHLLWLYARDNDAPFAEIGLTVKPSGTATGAPQDPQGAQNVPLLDTSSTATGTPQGALNAPPIGNGKGGKKHFSCINDSSLMYAFFKANIESVEKYNYLKSHLRIKQDERKDEARERDTE